MTSKLTHNGGHNTIIARPLVRTMLASIAPLAMLLLAATPASAQLYKSIGPDGKVTYSDTPPQTKNAKVERKNLGASGNYDANLPFELTEAVKNHPVTVYTGANCAPCDEARSYLKQRGVPFSEKTVSSNADLIKLKQIAGALTVPLIMVGRTKYPSFEPGQLQSALTAAGYPEANKLPSNYVFRPPEAAAPVVEPKAVAIKPEPPAEEVKPPTPTPESNAPPGFRF